MALVSTDETIDSLSKLVYKHPLSAYYVKEENKENGVYCVCANLIFPGYQVKNAFHLGQIKPT